MAPSCEELTHWKRPWCWEGLGAGGEGDDRGWDGWTASPTRWAWVWVNSGSWWWTRRPDLLRFMVSQSRTQLSHWTELNWTLRWICMVSQRFHLQFPSYTEYLISHSYFFWESLLTTVSVGLYLVLIWTKFFLHSGYQSFTSDVYYNYLSLFFCLHFFILFEWKQLILTYFNLIFYCNVLLLWIIYGILPYSMKKR